MTPWEELGIPENNWIEICLIMGVYRYPRLQVRMPYPNHTEVEWSTVETFRKCVRADFEKKWSDVLGWDCCARVLGLRGEVIREFTPDRGKDADR